EACGLPLVSAEEAPAADVAVDAIFGTGLSRAPSGNEARAIEGIHRARGAGAKVGAGDGARGLHPDTGPSYPAHVVADETVTFHAPKRGLYLHPAAELAGRVQVADIGIPQSLELKLSAPACELLDEQWARERFPRRPRNAHKNDFGHLLVVAGSAGESGAGGGGGGGGPRGGGGPGTPGGRPRGPGGAAAGPGGGVACSPPAGPPGRGGA